MSKLLWGIVLVGVLSTLFTGRSAGGGECYTFTLFQGVCLGQWSYMAIWGLAIFIIMVSLLGLAWSLYMDFRED